MIDSDDCRKLFKEIQKITRSEKMDINNQCEICIINNKQYALQCGHLFCNACVSKMDHCAFCKKSIDKTKIIKLYL